jgi:hypothetical protein
LIPETLRSLKSILDQIPIRWVLIGALAANRYRSSPRMTGDVDLLLADFGEGLNELEGRLISAGWRVTRADAGGELLRLVGEKRRVADLLIAGTEYQQIAIDRAITEPVDRELIPVLTVEDVLLHKLIAGRFQDLADIEAILETDPVLDRVYLDHWLEFWDLRSTWNTLTR